MGCAVMKKRSCGVCGLTVSNDNPQYYRFLEIRGVYQVGFSDICENCGNKASSFVDYYGIKRDCDLINLNQFLCGGIVVMQQYSQLVNAGYY